MIIKLLRAVWRILRLLFPVAVCWLFILHLRTNGYLEMSCSERILSIRRDYNGTSLKAKGYFVSWYDVPFFIKVRPATLNRTFSTCEYNNCELSLSRADVCKSDAVIYKGRLLPYVKTPIKRPNGQIWIFAEDEAPPTWNDDLGEWDSENYNDQFNWTMTYDKTNTDIYLPYGEFVKRNAPVHRDFLAIAKSKTKDAVIVTSNCNTRSLRMEYIKQLQEYISVDVLGKCGTKWSCGNQWIHDDCFDVLNQTYRYYLAFESEFCRGYRTEKLFENFKYDIILVTRGDMSAFADEPNGMYISTSTFKSAADLGTYLKSISNSPEAYAKLLKEKSNYMSVPYKHVYQKALCKICERLNLQEMYKKQIKSLVGWRNNLDNVCYSPPDI